ncbi:MAG: helix-turn-helix domain-containing protein, partial [Solirubrobacteraceae bacterium]
YYDRYRDELLRDQDLRAHYERTAAAIAQTDEIIRALDEMRVEMGVSKAELARRIDRNASSIRRLFTAGRAKPEFPLVVDIASALGLKLTLVPETSEAKKIVRRQRGHSKQLAPFSALRNG